MKKEINNKYRKDFFGGGIVIQLPAGSLTNLTGVDSCLKYIGAPLGSQLISYNFFNFGDLKQNYGN